MEQQDCSTLPSSSGTVSGTMDMHEVDTMTVLSFYLWEKGEGKMEDAVVVNCCIFPSPAIFGHHVRELRTDFFSKKRIRAKLMHFWIRNNTKKNFQLTFSKIFLSIWICTFPKYNLPSEKHHTTTTTSHRILCASGTLNLVYYILSLSYLHSTQELYHSSSGQKTQFFSTVGIFLWVPQAPLCLQCVGRALCNNP